jgi:hypothetical protein
MQMLSKRKKNINIMHGEILYVIPIPSIRAHVVLKCEVITEKGAEFP